MGCPAIEESEYFLFVIAVTLFEETGILGMDHLAVLVQHDEDGESETNGVVESLQQGFGQLCMGFIINLAWIVIHMDIDIVLVNDLAYCAVSTDKVSETQAPWGTHCHLPDR